MIRYQLVWAQGTPNQGAPIMQLSFESQVAAEEVAQAITRGTGIIIDVIRLERVKTTIHLNVVQ